MKRFHYTIKGKDKTLVASDQKYIARIEGTDDYILTHIETFDCDIPSKAKEKRKDIFVGKLLRLIKEGVYQNGQKFESLGAEAEIINGVLIWTRINKPVEAHCNEYVKFNEL